ncbi:hypothetical protein NDU88_000240 [Pleurodeles waltl]|uniref:Uncharacterized protein n=1 Tax=Pleurodeles waltl TaxID=8319 RepID=A0AAV7TEE7_PLEWA|nr:hypothetical protein NDU88_000240 [Pleurodeles waltl]
MESHPRQPVVAKRSPAHATRPEQENGRRSRNPPGKLTRSCLLLDVAAWTGGARWRGGAGAGPWSAGPGGLRDRAALGGKRGSRCPGLRRAPVRRRWLRELRRPSRFEELIAAGSTRAAKEPRWERPLRWGPPGLLNEVSNVQQAARATVELGPRLRVTPGGSPPGACPNGNRRGILVTRPPLAPLNEGNSDAKGSQWAVYGD